jgi:hypothetical protein
MYTTAITYSILIGVHGAGISHVAFMKPDSILIEIFPFGFQKRIYENLAHVLGVRYLSFLQSNRDLSVFHPEYLLDEGSLEDVEDIIRKPLNWSNSISKSYWRNQDISIDIKDFVQAFEITRKETLENTRYFSYMPWEGFGKQILAFKNACGVANLLGRTLILPKGTFLINSNYYSRNFEIFL